MTDCGCKNHHVKIVFIRHGFSCANEAQYHRGIMGRISKSWQSKYMDPPLTNYAISDAILARDIRKELGFGIPTIVFSSVLMRAQQTAYYLFPKNEIWIAPFISETNAGPAPNYDNQAMKPYDQQISMKKLNDTYRGYAKKHDLSIPQKFQSKRFVYNMVPDKKKSKHPLIVPWNDAKIPDYNKFMKWLEKFLENMIKKLNPPSNTPILVAVVGHSKFMMKHIKAQVKKKPKNIGMVELNFCLKPEYSVYRGKERNKYRLKKINQNTCNCKPLKSLYATESRHMSRYCDGIIFHGFPIPDKKRYGTDGGSNCPNKNLL